jgi:hypothetical protein
MASIEVLLVVVVVVVRSHDFPPLLPILFPFCLLGRLEPLIS